MPPVSGFVQRQRDQLVLNGEKFRIVGGNIYYFGFRDPTEQASLLQIADNFGVNVLRIWAFNDYRTDKGPPVPRDTDIYFQFLPADGSAPRHHEGPNGLGMLDSAVQ